MVFSQFFLFFFYLLLLGEEYSFDASKYFVQQRAPVSSSRERVASPLYFVLFIARAVLSLGDLNILMN